jgi:hypothetical protein
MVIKLRLECKHLYQFTYCFLENFELALLDNITYSHAQEDLCLTPDTLLRTIRAQTGLLIVISYSLSIKRTLCPGRPQQIQSRHSFSHIQEATHNTNTKKKPKAMTVCATTTDQANKAS